MVKVETPEDKPPSPDNTLTVNTQVNESSTEKYILPSFTEDPFRELLPEQSEEAEDNQPVQDREYAINDNPEDEIPTPDVIDLRSVAVHGEVLIVGPTIQEGPGLGPFTALVDSGAAASLVSRSTYVQLREDTLILGETQYKRIRGIGGVLFPVLGCVRLTLEFPGHSLNPSWFLVVDDHLSDYEFICGGDFLKENELLPDLHRKELVLREGDTV